MKKLLLFAFLLSIPLLGWGQKANTSFYETLEKKGYTEVEWTFKNKLIASARALDACSRKNDNCALTDPVTDQATKVIKQIELGWSWGATQSTVVQKSMASFEKAVQKNPNNKVLPWIIIESAFEKHSGYSYNAMSARMRIYIQSMESIDDDE